MRQADWSESTHAETIERRLGRECSMLTWVDTLGLAFYGHCRRRAGSREVETSRETGGSAFKGAPLDMARPSRPYNSPLGEIVLAWVFAGI
jgi:hypothetical protein